MDSFSVSRPGSRLVLAERAAHLVAGDVGRLRRLLHVHPELDDVQEELQQVLVLRVAALHGEGEMGRLPSFKRQPRRERHARPLARLEHVVRVLRLRSSTKLCMRWLMPMPVRPAMTAGIQPPLGVTDTTQPSSSAASIEVVPARKPSSNVSVPMPARGRRPRRRRRPECATARAGRGTDSAALERIGIAGRRPGRCDPGRSVAAAPSRSPSTADPHRLLGRKVGVAVVEVAVGEGEVHGLVERVDVARAVVAHRLEGRSSRGCSAPAAAPAPASRP